MPSATDRLSQLLLKNKILTEAQLAKALARQKEAGASLGRVLLEMGMVKENQLAEVIANELGMEYIDLLEYKINIHATTSIDEATASRYTCIPIDFEDEKMIVAMADPTNIYALDDIRLSTGYEVKPVVCAKDDIVSAIQRYYHLDTDVVEEALEARPDEEIEGISGVVDDTPLVRFTTTMIAEAINRGSSDIHIDPRENEVLIRYRIDGVCQEIKRVPKNIHTGIVSRIKIISDLNIAERRVPQDGHFGMISNGKNIDFRVAVLPTVYGEKVVMRILDRSSILLRLEDLGFMPQALEKFTEAFSQPHGALLVTGPTGSGKSTSLYATLNVLNTEEKNITTVEDPVEYRLSGINQVQVNPKAGLTFSNALRNILRTSPDILMVGEIRDRETAKTAIEAALTGHLVLSTLHTNDAPSALPRLIEMGVEAFLVSSAVNCVMAQRLIRKLCPNCKVPYEPDPVVLKNLNFPMNGDAADMVLYKANENGCAKCSGTGYKGRIGLYEVMPMSPEIQRLTVKEASSTMIMTQAIGEGLLTMKDDGFMKVKLGNTSIEEVMRVVAV
ncbi:MAG: type II secretion system protein GspE [Candidatus Solincola sediminis]|uniref:Type II secretion system protein GspE n=1 Tax=Candidatus Solincola sediminis TaxID=1797199 RepID=A0A1F2WHR1_9ACTN|nr:MAG: type II secretion system protein GspE [Candidatus Solincola sediminis]OFW61727.1 MAG: type II secretion system protein GspE [Candidatus Solincola sediminis]